MLHDVVFQLVPDADEALLAGDHLCGLNGVVHRIQVALDGILFLFSIFTPAFAGNGRKTESRDEYNGRNSR